MEDVAENQGFARCRSPKFKTAVNPVFQVDRHQKLSHPPLLYRDKDPRIGSPIFSKQAANRALGDSRLLRDVRQRFSVAPGGTVETLC